MPDFPDACRLQPINFTCDERITRRARIQERNIQRNQTKSTMRANDAVTFLFFTISSSVSALVAPTRKTAFLGSSNRQVLTISSQHPNLPPPSHGRSSCILCGTETNLGDSTESSEAMAEARKPGVASVEELQKFLATAGDRLLVADVRNPDSTVEPGDAKSIAVAPLPSPETRPLAQLLTYDRTTNSMPLPDVDKDTYIITHCGGGGRGLLAKNYLEENGFTNVINGGGPKEKELWATFGDK
jgi:rhodanese-related sulfurtransferase